MSDDQLRVIIDEDETPSSSRSRTTRPTVAELHAQADRSEAEAARLRQETARMRIEAARNRVSTALGTVEVEADAARAAHQNTLELGDYAGATKAAEKIAELKTRQERLQQEWARIEHAARIPADPVEAGCSGRTAPSAAWLRAHPDFVVDPRKGARLESAHWSAIADGHVPDTENYFRAVERRIGIRDGNSRGSDRRSGAEKYNKGDPNNHVLDGGRAVYLTPGEMKAATEVLVWSYGPNKGKFLGVEEYSRRKAAMIAQGRYNKLD